MRYEILEIVEPKQLEKKESVGYSTINVKRSVLQSVSIYGIVSFHNTMDEAISEIKEHGDVFKNKTLTILPIISFDINGNER